MYYAYIRVSKESQADFGYGLKAQQDDIEIFCRQRNIKLERIFCDAGISGKLNLSRREGLAMAISVLDKGDCLIVARRDRIGRNMDLVAFLEAEIEKKKAKLISIKGEGTETQDKMGSLMMRKVSDLFAEIESMSIGQRTKAALDAKKRRNERVGRIPYGYELHEDGIHLQECQEEKRILCKINQLRFLGWPIRAIVDKLNIDGDLNRERTPWTKSSVHRMLTQGLSKFEELASLSECEMDSSVDNRMTLKSS